MNDLIEKSHHIIDYIGYELKDLPKEEFYMVVNYIGSHLAAKTASELQAVYTMEILNACKDDVKNHQPEVTDE